MSSTAEIIKYYGNLLIIQYNGQPKARAMMEALVTPVIMDQLPGLVQAAYNVGDSVGVQLDILGKYVGVSRSVYTPSGPITLDDDDFRTLMKMVIIKNNSGSSLATIQNLLDMNFHGQIFVSDNQSMGLNYLILETLGSNDLLEALVYGGYLPAPMGVQVSAVIVPDITGNLFGFRTYDDPGDNISPFNNYSFYQLNYPWLSYST